MANIKIAQLTNQTAISDNDLIIVETATSTNKMTVANLKTQLGLDNNWKLIGTGNVTIPPGSTYESPTIINLTEPLSDGKVYAVEFRIGTNDPRQSHFTFFATVSTSAARIIVGIDMVGNIHSVVRAVKDEYPNALCLYAPIGASPIYVNRVWIVKDV